MTTDNTKAPDGASDATLKLLSVINAMNARLVRIETRQARQMLDAGTPLNTTKESDHAATSPL